MDFITKAMRKLSLTLAISVGFLAVSLIVTQASIARESTAQDARKIVDKVEETKVEGQKTEDKVGEKKVEGKVEIKAQKTVTIEAAEVKKVGVAVPAIKAAGRVNAPIIGFAVAAGAAANNEEALNKQFLDQFRPLLLAELRLLTTVCEPSPAQRREIALEGGKAVKESASKMAKAQQEMNQGRGINAIPDPRLSIRQALETAAKAKLSPDQFDRYKKEHEAVEKDQREAVLQNLIANLDKSMILSQDQRNRLFQSIMAQWDDKTYPTIETATIYEGYFPMIPKPIMEPILNAEQMKIWNGVPKIQFSSMRNYNFFNTQGNMVKDDNDDEDLKAALVEEVKKK